MKRSDRKSADPEALHLEDECGDAAAPAMPEFFADLADARLSEAEREQREAELAKDPELAGEYRRYLETIALLGEVGRDVSEQAPELRGRILQSLRAELGPEPVQLAESRRRPSWMLLASVAVAAASLALFAGLFSGQEFAESGPGQDLAELADEAKNLASQKEEIALGRSVPRPSSASKPQPGAVAGQDDEPRAHTRGVAEPFAESLRGQASAPNRFREGAPRLARMRGAELGRSPLARSKSKARLELVSVIESSTRPELASLSRIDGLSVRQLDVGSLAAQPQLKGQAEEEPAKKKAARSGKAAPEAAALPLQQPMLLELRGSAEAVQRAVRLLRGGRSLSVQRLPLAPRPAMPQAAPKASHTRKTAGQQKRSAEQKSAVEKGSKGKAQLRYYLLIRPPSRSQQKGR